MSNETPCSLLGRCLILLPILILLAISGGIRTNVDEYNLDDYDRNNMNYTNAAIAENGLVLSMTEKHISVDGIFLTGTHTGMMTQTCGGMNNKPKVQI